MTWQLRSNIFGFRDSIKGISKHKKTHFEVWRLLTLKTSTKELSWLNIREFRLRHTIWLQQITFQTWKAAA